MVKSSNNPLLSICAIIFVLTIGTAIVAPLLAPYSQQLGATGLSVGFIYSGFYLVRLVVGTPIGWLSDRFGPKGILTISLSIYPFIALSYYLSDNLIGLLGARLLHGLASAMLLPMAMTYIGEVTPKGKEGAYMGVYNTVLFLANGFGPIIGGVIAEWRGIKEAFLLLLISALVTFLLSITTLSSTRKWHQKVDPTKQAHEEVKEREQRAFLKNGNVLALSSIYFISAVVTIFIVSFFPLFGIERGFSTFQIGVLIAIFNITVGVCQIPFGKMADKYEKTRMLMASSLGMAILFCLMPYFHTFRMIGVLVFLFSLMTAIAIATSSAFASETGRLYGMGKTMGFLSSATSLGMVIGPLLSGLIIDYSSMSRLFFAIGSGWFISAILLKWNNSKKKQKWSVNKGEGTLSNNNP